VTAKSRNLKKRILSITGANPLPGFFTLVTIIIMNSSTTTSTSTSNATLMIPVVIIIITIIIIIIITEPHLHDLRNDVGRPVDEGLVVTVDLMEPHKSLGVCATLMLPTLGFCPELMPPD
jgi:hypothetical protein